MDLVSLDLRAKKPQVSWGTEQKVYLCCLFRFFERDMSLYKQVFDLEFQTELATWGFPNGVPSSRLDTRWTDMRLRGDPIWGYVHLSPFDMNGQWSSVIERIQIAAETLGIRLERKTADDIDVSRFTPTSRLTLSQQQVVGMTEEQTSSSPRKRPDNFPVDNLPPSKRREPEKLCTGGGKKCLWCSFHQLESEDASAAALQIELPTLLYRWSNVDTQGVNTRKLYLSGLAAEAEYFSPNDISAEEFNSFLSRHVHIDKVPSPFISTMMSLLAPLHRGTRSKDTAIVSIIDPNKLGTESPVFSAKDLMCNISLKVNGYYNGTGEYLVWWKIPASAIICSFKISDLMHIAQDWPAILELMQFDTIAATQGIRGGLRRKLAKGGGAVNMDTGILIGRLLCLLHIPYEYASLFEEGIDRGYQGCQNPLVHSLVHSMDTAREPEVLDDNSLEVMSISSGASGTVRSDSPSPQHPTVSVEIFNQRTQSWVDQHLARSSPEEPVHEGLSAADEDIDCLSISDTNEDETSENDEQVPQDLFEIGRARIRELLGSR
ncbi:hypothetical protein HFD88_004026 [Aspergillus terreus]|nr:hypothetical protein HFD88_004026 [Aspergillus terreus]